MAGRCYLFVSGELRLQDESLDIVEFLSLGVGALLASLDAEDHLPHDFEFLPVDAGFVLAHECLIAFFGRD